VLRITSACHQQVRHLSGLLCLLLGRSPALYPDACGSRHPEVSSGLETNLPVDSPASLIVVCGLGQLGRACLRTLLRFKVPLRCLDQSRPLWLDGIGQAVLAEALVIGDMRHPEALIRVGVPEARAVLLLSSDSGANLEAALQVSLLNPTARVVVRSNGNVGLELHLRERLPGLVLLDPELLTAGVFANALRPDGSEAAFSLEGELFGVVRRVVEGGDSDDLFSLQGRQRRLLQWCPAHRGSPGPPASQWWDLNDKPRAGDQLLWLETLSTLDSRRPGPSTWLLDARTRLGLAVEALPEAIGAWLRRWSWGGLAGAGLLTLVLLVGSKRFGNGSLLRGVLLTIALLKGEYIDALSAMTGGGVLGADQLGLAALSLAFALGGTLLTAWVVAVILDRLLARRLGRREPAPLATGTSYVLVIGGHRLAQRIESLLRQGRFRVRRVQPDGRDPSDRVFASLDRALRLLRHGRCQGVAVLGDDTMANLEMALGLQDRWPRARLAVQAHSFSGGAQLNRLFPGMEVVNPLELAAEAVVATAFGERVREVLRVADTNLLLTDYRVEEGDTLAGRSLGQIAEGYGVMPVALTPQGQTKSLQLPKLDRVVQPGDALLVLAALTGLRAVELGSMRSAAWRLELQGATVGADRFEAQMLLARHLDQPPGDVAPYLDFQMGPRLSPPLPQAQGRELEVALRRLGILCTLIPLSPGLG
jgi:Trk K+ transport system NAD-binding subunit